MKLKKLVVAMALMGSMGAVNAQAEGVAVMDFGALDTLDALNLSAQVSALPKKSLPSYLSQYQADTYADLGNLKTADLEALKAVQPDAIIATGRQQAQFDAYAQIAPLTQLPAIDPNQSWHSFAQRVGMLAQQFGDDQTLVKASAQLAELKQFIAQQQAAVKGDRALFVTHNGGHFTYNSEVDVAQWLGIEAPALPAHVESIQRGTRTFTPVNAEDIALMAPKTLFVIDRSAAIGDEALDQAQLKDALAQQHAAGIKVVVLSPELWYLSGNGLESVRLQVEEVVAGLK